MHNWRGFAPILTPNAVKLKCPRRVNLLPFCFLFYTDHLARGGLYFHYGWF